MAFLSLGVGFRPSCAGPPGDPAMVAPGVISTPDDEFGFAATPDGRSAYFTKRTPTTNSPPRLVICETEWRDGRWSEPRVAPFSGRYSDFGAAVSTDGRRLFFTSDRPHDGSSSGEAADYNLWVLERAAGGGWGEPRNLGAPINTAGFEGSPSVAEDGTLYFASFRPGGKGGLDLYRSRWVDGRFGEPENLSALNSEATETQPAVSPDGSLVVFVAIGRDGELREGGAPYPRADLYLSRSGAGGWSAPVHLDPPLNSPAAETTPAFSADGHWFTFASERGAFHVPMPHRPNAGALERARRSVLNGAGNIYRVPVERLGPEGRPLLHLVGEGVISTPADEFGGQLADGGATLFFNRSIPRSQNYTVLMARRHGKGWSEPSVASFSGTWRDFDVTVSLDGKRLYFISDRPLSAGVPNDRYNVWRMERTAGGWGAPRPLDRPINGDWGNHFAAEARDGTLYFTSDRPGGKGLVDVWTAEPEGEGYGEPTNLGDAINGPNLFNLEVAIAPDESFLVLTAAGRDDSQGDSDLYVSYRQDGRWLAPQSLGPRLNTAAREYSPRLSPDGRRLLFASERGVPTEARAAPWTYAELVGRIHGIENGLGNLYEVDLARILPAPTP